MKKLLVIIVAIFVLALAGCGSADSEKDNKESANEDKEKSQRIALVLPEKIGVNPFFQQMDEGAEKAAEEFGVDFKTIESADHSGIEENLRIAVSEDYDLIITTSFESEDALLKVAAENPDQKFAIIDTVVDLPNVTSITFNEQEAAYLLGAAAGLATKTDKIGMIVAADIPLMKKWTVALEDGAKSMNPDVDVLINYVGSFDDPARAKELALLQASKGVDFIAGLAAVGDLGVFEAAKEEGFYTAGQDIDRTVLDPKHIVLSQLKGTDAAAYETIKAFVAGDLDTGIVSYGLADEGVGLTFVTHESETPLHEFIGEDVIKQVIEIKDQIVDGSLKVENPLNN